MLSKERISELLNTLHEHKMAREVFVPVLKKMGLKGVRYTGGTDEHGIDVEYYETTQPENHKSYVGIQFKKGDLTYGAGGGKNTVKEVKNQAEEAFEKEIHDLDGKGVYYISRFIVATTGDINEPARKYIGKARQKGKDRIDYWTGDRLAEYIQTHWIDEFEQYFKINDEEEEEDFEETIVDKDYIQQNYEKLVKQCLKLKSAISSFEWDMLDTLLELQFNNDNNPVPFADFLIELRRSEDQIENELKKLIGQLKFIKYDDECHEVELYGKSIILLDLVNNIVSELHEADEDTEFAIELFRSVTKSWI